MRFLSNSIDPSHYKQPKVIFWDLFSLSIKVMRTVLNHNLKNQLIINDHNYIYDVMEANNTYGFIIIKYNKIDWLSCLEFLKYFFLFFKKIKLIFFNSKRHLYRSVFLEMQFKMKNRKILIPKYKQFAFWCKKLIMINYLDFKLSLYVLIIPLKSINIMLLNNLFMSRHKSN